MFPIAFASFVITSLLLPVGPSATVESAVINTAQRVQLNVPFIWEIPDGVWTPPWSGACEEASVRMVDQFYLGDTRTMIPRAEMKTLMAPLFSWQTATYGSNLDSDAARTAAMVQANLGYSVTIANNPTLEEIKQQLRDGHPVISLHYGYGLKNPKHRFRAGSSSYHMMVITGYDDAKQEFIINDPELRDGRNIRYRYSIIMDSLHNFNHTTKRADGAPVVLFTSSEELVKTASRHRVYLVRNGKKQYITHPRAFATHSWGRRPVKVVDAAWLNALPNGPDITK